MPARKGNVARVAVSDSNRLSLAWDHWLADFSKQCVMADTIALLLAHALAVSGAWRLAGGSSR
ncbi:MAG TPA: hypothetical protein VEN29_10875 [Casimicrobiaceae bacterium]|nr:hypothetical protein [Casimicrobiaceae bacterium]